MSTDHRDWDDRAANIGDVTLLNAAMATHATDTIFSGWVGSWEALQVYLDPVAGSWSGYLKAHWFADAALTELIAIEDWASHNGCIISDIVPNHGPYLDLSLLRQGGVGTVDMRMMIRRFTPRKPAQAWYGVLASGTVNIPAGVTNSFPVFQYTSGPALWVLDTNAAVWKAYLEATNAAGGILGVLDYADNVNDGAGFGRMVTIPTLQPQVTLQNGDAVARSFTYTLTAVL